MRDKFPELLMSILTMINYDISRNSIKNYVHIIDRDFMCNIILYTFTHMQIYTVNYKNALLI